jgi:DUF1365 family protein
MKSALYLGTVIHHRFRPRQHHLRYRLCWMLFDLDELGALPTRLLSHNRANLVSFRDRDHLDGSDTPPRAQIEAHLHAAGLTPDGGPIRVLCMPRVLGHVFNPISVWFCHRRDESLAAILYEVNNTFGQRHCYLIPVDDSTDHSTDRGTDWGTGHGTDPTQGADDKNAPVIRQRCEKRFYVSPFMDMDMTYDFRVVPPGAMTSVVVDGSDTDGRMITASFTGQRRGLTDASLLGVVLRFAMLTSKVVAAIHWEAARLWMKGVRLQPRPAPPDRPVTIVPLSKS